MKKYLVAVKGSTGAQKPMVLIYKRAGRHAEILTQTNKLNNKETNEMENKGINPIYPRELVYGAPRLVGKDPDSCSIM